MKYVILIGTAWIMAVSLTGCSGPPPPTPLMSMLVKPAAATMEPVPLLLPVPKDEADPKKRLAYYVKSRQAYATLRDRHRALQAYVRTATSGKAE